MLVEAADAGINWLEPRDFEAESLPRAINPKSGKGISSLHGGATALFADGSVRLLPDDLPPATLEALLTRDGGEAVDLGGL